MKVLRVIFQLCLLCVLSLAASVASASTLTLSGSLHFPALDGSAQDADGLANGVFSVAGDLVLEGTIHCNDASPLLPPASACPIRIAITGNMTMEAGSGIFAENQRSLGNGGNIRLDVGGDLTLQSPDGSLPGAVVSTSRTTSTPGNAGSLTAVVGGTVDLQAGSTLAANSQSGSAGAISVTGETVRVAGLVASGPSRTVLSTRLTGGALAGGIAGQAGGTIHLRALGSSEPGIRIETDGIVASQGELLGGGRLVLLEACGIEVRGLVASLSKGNGPSQVVLRSGRGILVDGRDLSSADPADGRRGRVRADGTQQGATGYLVDLFSASDLQILGPDSGSTSLFAVSSNPGELPLREGGSITAISLAGALTATGNALDAGRDNVGNKGGFIDLQARADVTLDDATLRAVGGLTGTGGHIDVRSFQGNVSWTFGRGDVRPTGTLVLPSSRRGTIRIMACAAVDTTGSQFPVNGSAVAPFPVETEGVCSADAPSLPSGEPPLQVCITNEPPAPSGGPFTLPENSANGTVVGTVSANDPDAGQTHTFAITAGNTGGTFAIGASTGQITVANSAALNFETTPSFTLTVEVTDNGTPVMSGTATVVVNLTDVNEPPVPSGGPFAISESSPNGTNVGTVSAGDPDAGQTHTFSITAGNTGGAFAINPSTGQITVANSAALDFETNPTFNLTVQVTDSGTPSLSGSTTVTINLQNVPEGPIATDEGTPASPYVETVGNTILEVTASPVLSGAKVVFNGNLLANDTDPDGPTAFTITLESATAGAVVTLNSDGTFTYLPPPGFTGVDSFTYRITDPDGLFDTANVYINVEHRVWYVKNDAAAGGLGRSTDPFDTLAEAESASSDGDTIYLFEGDGTTAGQSDGITLKDGQRLIGEAVELAAPATVNINGVDGLVLRAATGNRPKIENDDTPDAAGEDDGVSVQATAGNMNGIEICGLDIAGFDNAIDVTATSANNASVTIRDNVISGANLEGIDINAGSTGTVTLAIHHNTVTANGTAIDIQRTAGATYITVFESNAVGGNTGGMGINITGAIFDLTPGGAFNTVSGGATVIGTPGNGVGGTGLVLNNVQGDLSFADLDVFADGGAGLRASGTGGGMTLGVLPGVGIVEATGGPAVDLTAVALTLPLSSIKSTNSPTTGLALNNVTGSFSAGSGSSISNIISASGTAFQVGSSNAAISYAGTISTTTGKGVDLTGNTGSTIDFTGTLSLSSGASTAFNATGGGTVTATDTVSTLTTTTGTALNVANTTIGVSGLTFKSISANGAVHGIALNNTGTSGGLTVTGDGSANSGGIIQSSTGDGISLANARNITLNRMRVASSGESHIDASVVTNLTLNNLDTDTSTDHGILGNNITNLTINGGTFQRGGAGAEPTCNKDGVRITNLLGASAVTGATFSRSNTRQFSVVNNTTSSAPDTLTISGTTWNAQTGPCSGDHVSVAADTGGNFKIITNGSSGENNFSTGGIGIQVAALGSGTMQASITGVETSGNTAGVVVSGTANGNVSFNVYDNRSELGTGFSGTGSVALLMACTTTGQCEGAFTGNSIVHTAGPGTNAMQVTVEGNGTGRVIISNNTVSGNFQRGLQGQSRSGAGSLSLHVSNNNFTATDAAGLQVMNFEVGASGAGTTNKLCLNLANNTATPAGGMPAYRLFHRSGYTYQLQDLAQASTSNPADVQTWVTTTKANAGTPITVGIGSTPFTTSVGCSLPTLPSP